MGLHGGLWVYSVFGGRVRRDRDDCFFGLAGGHQSINGLGRNCRVGYFRSIEKETGTGTVRYAYCMDWVGGQGGNSTYAR